MKRRKICGWLQNHGLLFYFKYTHFFSFIRIAILYQVSKNYKRSPNYSDEISIVSFICEPIKYF